MLPNYEKEIFSQELTLTTSDIMAMITEFFHRALELQGIIWDIESSGIKQILITYKDNQRHAENKLRNGYYEINPVSTRTDKPVRLRIVSLREDVDIWWLNLAQVIQAKGIAPDLSSEAITSISRDLLLAFRLPGMHETNGKTLKRRAPEKPPMRSGVSRWLDYFYECKKAGNKISLKQLASLSGYDYNYIRQMHSQKKHEYLE